MSESDKILLFQPRQSDASVHQSCESCVDGVALLTRALHHVIERSL